MKKINKLYELRIFIKRTRKKLKRKQKHTNNNYRFMGQKVSKIITIPPYLDLEKHLEKTLDFIKNLGEEVRENESIVIDHSYMIQISQEALLLLTSEIERSIKKKDSSLKGNKKFMPKNKDIKELLNKIGYWKYFNIKSQKNKSSHKGKYYLDIKSDTKANPMYVGELIEFFEQIISFEDNIRDKFNDALFEAVANVVEHAYIENQKIFYIEGKWWLTASLDFSNNIVSFTIFDQGIGIFKSLGSPNRKKPLSDGLKNIVNMIKSKDFGKIPKLKEYPKITLLKKLINESEKLSRHETIGRGNGFKSFKRFINEVESGEMLILTDNISYKVISGETKILEQPLNGTLISWTIKVDNNSNKKIHLKKEI